ncbi:MAG: GMC family oxidoreductase N-terminal domain-containing protein [Ectothiorhodospiraceae bacterium]|nr:GMC family oxidoreductase N-terminal domain-containing protein [Ectothiorhodospiraceae bacterium]
MTDSFDHVIVGAGSAGCVLANRLSATGASVAVIEAGGRDRHPYIHIPAGYARILDHPQLTWGFRTEADPTTGIGSIAYPRGRVWGGCSSINGLGHVRGDPSDYDLWAQKGCTGWGWDDLLPYFMRHESFADGGEGRGRDGPQVVSHLAERPELLDHFAAAAEAIGLPVNADMNGPRREGFATFQQTRRGQRRISAARAFLVPALSRPNLTVVDDAMAERVVIRDGRAEGVTIRRGGETRTIRARFGVVLAAGAIGSPHLLMLSGIGPGAHLAEHGIAPVRDAPDVGRNLQDHFIVRMIYRLTDHRWSANRRIVWPRLALEVVRWMVSGKGVLTWSPGMMSLFARTEPGLEVPDVQINGGPVSWADGRIGVPEREPGFTLGVWQCRPHSRGTVTLKSPRAEDAPAIAPRYLTERADQACVVRGLRLARRWMAAEPLRGIVAHEVRPGPDGDDDDTLLDYARRTGGTVYHPSCTVRMGGDPAAPLDPRLRVRGIEGLRVADAAVFPDMPICNINATVLSVAEKAADLIIEDARHARR